jgi:hypothetical protein
MKGAAPYRVAKYGRKKIKKVTEHHLRAKDENGKLMTKSNDDIDVARSASANRYWLAGHDDGKMWLSQSDVDALDASVVRKAIDARLAAANAELRSGGCDPLVMRENSILMIEVVIDIPSDWWNSHTEKERNKFFTDALRFNDKEFGEENRVFIAAHGDERNGRVHVHIGYVPLTKDLRLSAKDVIGGPSGLHRRQERYFNEVAEPAGMPRPDFGDKTMKHLSDRAYKMAKEMAKTMAAEQVRAIVSEAEEAAAALRAEAEEAKEKAMRKHAESVERMAQIDAYFAEVESLLPGLLDALRRGDAIDKEKYAALFRAKERMRELDVSRSRDFRRIEQKLRELVEKRDSLGRAM